ncbi:MAG: ATP-binding protein [Streptosporangiaceae bacterium]
MHAFAALTATEIALEVTVMYTSRASTGAVFVARPPTCRDQLELAIAPAAVRVARHWIAGRLACASPPVGPDLIDTAVLVVSELVTNAVRAVGRNPGHPPGGQAAGPGRVAVAVAAGAHLVRVEVHDSARAPLPPSRRGADTDETGRGLTVVEALSICWGWEPGPLGKVVWCELAVRAGSGPGDGAGAAPDGADPGWRRQRL